MMQETNFHEYCENKTHILTLRWMQYKSEYKKGVGEEVSGLKAIQNLLRIENEMIKDILDSVRNCGYENENNISPDQLQDVIFQLNCQTWFIMEEINGRCIDDTLNHLTEMYTFIEGNDEE